MKSRSVVAILACIVACKRAPVADRTVALDAAATERTCRTNEECRADEWCTFTPGLCGKGKTLGRCRARPSSCDGVAHSPVCGCDGAVFDHECAAHARGVDLAANGGCRAQVKDWIACGPRFCDARVAYCEIVLSDVFELPSDYACRALPPACRPDGGVAATCDCFPQGTRCLSFCGPIESAGLSGFHLTCRL